MKVIIITLIWTLSSVVSASELPKTFEGCQKYASERTHIIQQELRAINSENYETYKVDSEDNELNGEIERLHLATYKACMLVLQPKLL